jgi:hypothetical protein
MENRSLPVYASDQFQEVPRVSASQGYLTGYSPIVGQPHSTLQQLQAMLQQSQNLTLQQQCQHNVGQGASPISNLGMSFTPPSVPLNSRTYDSNLLQGRVSFTSFNQSGPSTNDDLS